MVDVCLLGTGGMMPLPGRWLTSMLFRFNGRMVLVDCGEGTQIPIKMAGWGFKPIEVICFTHYHADHIAGLPGLLLTIGNNGREEPLMLMGPPGLTEVVKGLTVVADELPFEVRLLELSDTEPQEIRLGALSIHTLPVEHTSPCLAYSLEVRRANQFEPLRAKALGIPTQLWNHLQQGEAVEVNGHTIEPAAVLGAQRKGLKVSYCTDTRPVEALKDFVRGSDLFICEGMYGDNAEIPKAEERKHMTYSEAAGLARDGAVEELWLTHFSPSMHEPELFIDNARDVFPNTVLGRDLMKKGLNYG